MESDPQHQEHHHQHHQQHHHQKQSLARYQSAPSSYLSSLLDRQFIEDILNRPSSPETEQIFARFLSDAGGNSSSILIPDQNQNQNPRDEEEKIIMEVEPQQPPQIMNNPQSGGGGGVMQHQQRYSSFYQGQSQQQNLQSSEMDYRVMPSSSVGMDRFSQLKTSGGDVGASGGGGGGGGNSSNLIRQSSSPAGLFSDIHIEKGYVVMKGMGGGGDYGGGGNRETTFTSAARPPQPPLPPSSIPPMSPETSNYSSGFAVDSWDDISGGGGKRLREDDRTFSSLTASEIQNLDATGSGAPPLLAHHLSLPKDLTAIEKLLQFPDSVPCKIRAKRGFATHPRSIAERVRRTKISERMRKLQDLVPNMDKQTNTADMLDLAVDYVKELQQQLKILGENRAKCTCPKKQET